MFMQPSVGSIADVHYGKHRSIPYLQAESLPPTLLFKLELRHLEAQLSLDQTVPEPVAQPRTPITDTVKAAVAAMERMAVT
jgi:hypothetical protein